MKIFLSICSWSSVFSAFPQNGFIQILGFALLYLLFFLTAFAPRGDPEKAFWPQICCHIKRESVGAKPQFWNCSLTDRQVPAPLSRLQLYLHMETSQKLVFLAANVGTFPFIEHGG